jgi:hypothetical protein
MAWELIESTDGNISHEELLGLYQLLLYSSSEIHIEIAKKIQAAAEIAKHEINNGLRTWESEGGACPPHCNNEH